MRNKIGIFSTNRELLSRFEYACQEFIDEGAELFLVSNQESALVLLKKEQPQLVFMESSFFDQRIEVQGELVIIKTKAFTSNQIIKKCREVLKKGRGELIPPM